MSRAQIALIIPLGDAPGHIPGYRPDNELPGGGRPSRPVDPGWGVGDGPVDPGYGWGGGEHPSNRPPGSEHPGNRPPGSFPGYPTGGPIVPPQGGTVVPEDEYQPLPPPEDIYSQYIVSVWDPKTATWTTKSYPPR
jgi:hypothetical protein